MFSWGFEPLSDAGAATEELFMKATQARALSCFLLISTLLALPASAQCDPTEVTKIVPDDGQANALFGRWATMENGVAVIAAPFDGSGSAYVFRSTGGVWSQEAKLVPDDPSQGSLFGFGVALTGDFALVGAPSFDAHGKDGTGSAFVFRNVGGTWTQDAQLSVRRPFANFGFSVAANEGTLLVGADSDNALAGSATLFRRNDVRWVNRGTLERSDPQSNDLFGTSVALDGRVAVVGADQAYSNGEMTGTAYVFRRYGDTYVQEAKLEPSDGRSGDQFGISVAIDGEVAVVGAWAHPAAYVYRRTPSGWIEEAKLTYPSAAAFGTSVAVRGDVVLVGAPHTIDAGLFSGAAYLFRFDGTSWSEGIRIVPDDAAAYQQFGSAVALDGDVALIGAFNDSAPAEFSGSAYVFDVSSCNTSR
jgi:hypothetical protein